MVYGLVPPSGLDIEYKLVKVYALEMACRLVTVSATASR